MPVTIQPERENEVYFPNRKRFTRDEVKFLVDNNLLTERYELIDGEIVIKMPQNRPHRITLLLISIWMEQVFGREYVETQQSVKIQKPDALYNIYEPDILVHNRSALEMEDNEPANDEITLVVEVSDSTLSTDRDIKAEIYARSNYGEYWIANVKKRQIIVHREPTENGYKTVSVYSADEEISPLARPNAKIRVNDLFLPDVSSNEA